MASSFGWGAVPASYVRIRGHAECILFRYASVYMYMILVSLVYITREHSEGISLRQTGRIYFEYSERHLLVGEFQFTDDRTAVGLRGAMSNSVPNT